MLILRQKRTTLLISTNAKRINLDKYIRKNYKLDDFDIIKVDNNKKGALGIGSFATVNLGKVKESGKLYALK